MMSLVPRLGKIEYEHYAIDPYGNLEYDQIIQWKRDGKWSSEAPRLYRKMRDQMI